MKPEGSLMHLQVPATCPYPDPDQTSPRPPSHSLKIHLYSFLPSIPGSSKWYPTLRCPHQNTVYTPPLPHTCYMFCPSHFSRLDQQQYWVRSTDHSAPHYVVFSTLLLPHLSWAYIFSSVPYSQTPLDYIPPSM